LQSKEIITQEKTSKIPDGWVISTFHEGSRTINKEYGKNTYFNKDITSLEMMTIIANKYDKWKKHYITIWGEDEYEKMYRFKNYDYKYFDKLDEMYEYEMEENYDDSSYTNSDYEINDDGYE
jgi:hypothetical protein